MKSIYLDNNRVTKIDPQIIKIMEEFYNDNFGELHVLHYAGAKSRKIYNEALEKIYASIHASDKDTISFTSGASESNATVFYSTYLNYILTGRKNSIIVGEREPESIMQMVDFLRSQGVRVHTIPINGDGVIEYERIYDYITPRTALVSVSMVDGESGAINPIDKIAEACSKYEVPFHTDATYAIGKIPIDMQDIDISYLSFSSETLHAPAGCGVLYIKEGFELLPLIYGNRSQAESLRGGPLNLIGIAALGKAVELASDALDFEMQDTKELRDELEEKLREIKGVQSLVPWALRVPNTLLLAVEGVESEAMLYELNRDGIAAYSNTIYPYGEWDKKPLPSAMGLDKKLDHTTIGFALSRFNNEEEIKRVIESFSNAIEYLREFMPKEIK